PMTVKAMKAGAVEFLTKPFDPEALLVAIGNALERSRNTLFKEADGQILRSRLASLSRRGRQVMELVVCGCLNKEAAAELDISEITVKAHRGRVMRKMEARSLADLVRIAAELGLAAPAKRSASQRNVGRGAPALPNPHLWSWRGAFSSA